MNVTETDDIWRLYTREWVIVHTITMPADNQHTVASYPCFTAAMDWITNNLKDRVRDHDYRISLNSDDDKNPLTFWAHIEVFKDNLKGEFKDEREAKVHASVNEYDEFIIVPRNSKSDHEIRAYGVVKL